jgi:hypothetical protein
MNVLRRAWPIVDLTPHRHAHQIVPKIATHCRCGELQLSRDPQDLLRLLHEFRGSAKRPSSSSSATAPLELSLYLSPQRPRSLAG